MPIEYWIDDKRRLVMAKGIGTVTDQDVFGHQRDVWSRAELAGYDELIDMSHVEHIADPSAGRIHELAQLGAAMDAPAMASRFAIVAPEDVAFGLGRMYEIYRGMDHRSTKRVGVFRTLEEALAFLSAGRTEKQTQE